MARNGKPAETALGDALRTIDVGDPSTMADRVAQELEVRGFAIVSRDELRGIAWRREALGLLVVAGAAVGAILALAAGLRALGI